MNLDSIIDTTSKLSFSISLFKLSDWEFNLIKNIFRLKRLRFSVLDSLGLNEAKLLCLVLITFVYSFYFN